MTIAVPACSEQITTTNKPPAPCTSEAVFLVGGPDSAVRTPCGVHIGVAMPDSSLLYTVTRIDEATMQRLMGLLAAR
ncbi:hypothetical protein [Streptomyces sp. R44]|uniref:Uncharacterized protein n=1 Tax=Streptomyces sp. R44 TaxID=3238633 RepID=A0AB39SQC8_9ACTN